MSRAQPMPAHVHPQQPSDGSRRLFARLGSRRSVALPPEPVLGGVEFRDGFPRARHLLGSSANLAHRAQKHRGTLDRSHPDETLPTPPGPGLVQ